MLYRKEIDGLRALAVLPVILFHAGFAGVSGGYIGVDIFFVISGYLITTIIIEEKKKDSFSIINFYERRSRRILPALSIVLITTTVASYLLLPTNLLKSYSQSLVSVTTFSSNVFFYLTNGYFSAASDEKPLLHTWSLAVEEQFYLFFPILITLFWAFGRKLLICGIIFFSFCSLFLAQYLSSINANDANFYLIFSRAWELFFGSLIAFMPQKKIDYSKWKSQLFSSIGFCLIIYSIIYFNKGTPFPSFYTLIPVVGTCLIIVFADNNTYIGRSLSNRVFVFIGLISYSLYLWHQPIFAFLRLKSIAEPPKYMFLLAIVLTFFCAYLSWKFIETPFRNKTKYTTDIIFKYSLFSIVFFLTIGFVGHFYNGFDSRFDVRSYTDSLKYSPKRDECHTKGHDFLPPNEACKYFGNNVTWAIFGDSHTVEPSYALAKRLEKSNIGLIHLSFSGCSPALLFEVKQPGCTKWINESLVFLEQNRNIKSIFLGFRHSYHLFGDQLETYPAIPNNDPSEKFADEFRNSLTTDSAELYWKSFAEIVSRLMKSGKTVYILYPIPELPLDINKAMMPLSVFGKNTIIDLQKTTSATYYFNRNKYIISKLDSLPFSDNLRRVDPFKILCDEEYCPAVRDNKALYFDDNHLSLFGSELIVKSITIENKLL